MAVDGWDGGPRMVDRWLRAAIRVVPHRGAPGPRLLARVGGVRGRDTRLSFGTIRR